tara:strand:+ start:207 stop:770 length:564 start_codon:yes stop_codon:yes gene_type:complete
VKIPEHGKYLWLPILYEITKHLNPKKIVEFGPGVGFTTTTMALAIKDLGSDSLINSYDIWMDKYWGKKKTSQKFFDDWGVGNQIVLNHLDFYDWIELPKEQREFDLLYFDINNTGEKLLELHENVKDQIKNGSVVLFEGGSVVRDNYGAAGSKMSDLQDKIGYKLLTGNIKYSLSAIYNEDIYNLEY